MNLELQQLIFYTDFLLVLSVIVLEIGLIITGIDIDWIDRINYFSIVVFIFAISFAFGMILPNYKWNISRGLNKAK